MSISEVLKSISNGRDACPYASAMVGTCLRRVRPVRPVSREEPVFMRLCRRQHNRELRSLAEFRLAGDGAMAQCDDGLHLLESKSVAF